ncbi:hypothetical protein LVB87_11405 [Lysobacter sp. KIS68-7]|uniref:hypothetical protein n=1 Tax=Lysobacter sp. KIS68-7 TaxID=2904252 RepID=UPI001E33FB6A|nr:hypothetical protein [Lysobacter sp. KIS68-7]UHQ18788.1 hypothetical protein LVB87_11405 [Lysobacter sp. KIS68-7]
MGKIRTSVVVFVGFWVAGFAAASALYKLGTLTGADSFGLGASAVGFFVGFISARFAGPLGACVAMASAMVMALCESALVFLALTPSHLEAFPVLEVLGSSAIPLFTVIGCWIPLRRRGMAPI